MQSVESLVDRIYEAATEPSNWPRLLTDIAGSANAKGGVLAVADKAGGWGGYQISEHLTERFEHCVKSDTSQRSIQTTRLLAADACRFISDEELFSEEEFAADPWTTEWAVHNGVYHGAATAIHAPTGELMVVQIMRGIEAGAMDRHGLGRLDVLRPHLARSCYLAARWRLQRVRAAAEALAMVGLPAAVLDLQGRVLAANDLIQSMTAHIAWLPHDQLSFRDASATTLLRKGISELDQPIATSVRSFPARGTRAGKTVVAHLVPARRSAQELFGGGFGVLVVTPITSPAPPDTALIQALFDLTPAEARIARGIVEGQTIAEMATSHGVAVETIRSQVKAVLAKTGVRRQAEAAVKLAALPRIGPNPETLHGRQSRVHRSRSITDKTAVSSELH